MKTTQKISQAIKKIFQNPKFRGKHIVMIAGHIYATKTPKEAIKIFNKVTKKYPDQKPTVTYIPKAESLILIVWR